MALNGKKVLNMHEVCFSRRPLSSCLLIIKEVYFSIFIFFYLGFFLHYLVYAVDQLITYSYAYAYTFSCVPFTMSYEYIVNIIFFTFLTDKNTF